MVSVGRDIFDITYGDLAAIATAFLIIAAVNFVSRRFKKDDGDNLLQAVRALTAARLHTASSQTIGAQTMRFEPPNPVRLFPPWLNKRKHATYGPLKMVIRQKRRYTFIPLTCLVTIILSFLFYHNAYSAQGHGNLPVALLLTALGILLLILACGFLYLGSDRERVYFYETGLKYQSCEKTCAHDYMDINGITYDYREIDHIYYSMRRIAITHFFTEMRFNDGDIVTFRGDKLSALRHKIVFWLEHIELV